MRQSFLNKLILTLTLLSSSSVMARQFDIEVIIFQRNLQPENVSEAWPDELTPINYANTLRLTDSEGMALKGATPLGRASKELNQQYAALQQHAGFEPLAHLVWRQGDEGRQAAPSFHIEFGKNYAEQYYANGMSKKDNPQYFDNSDVADVQRSLEQTSVAEPAAQFDETVQRHDAPLLEEARPLDPSLYQLEGRIQVYVQHFLFIESAFDLRIPSRKEVIVGSKITNEKQLIDQIATGEEISEETLVIQDPLTALDQLQRVEAEIEVQDYLKTYRMEERRRMRSGETHYLDHPLMGLIIQVRRVDESAENTELLLIEDDSEHDETLLLADEDNVADSNDIFSADTQLN
ncbi:CsiV family protein [Thaumasiovibrio sp. DFM-14]|uniref:CsiV family protein n=1 Tax=Thaumasiovibrio sp. DFM-14 TaxID=3384792 RepID=UPI0039A1FF91